MDPKLVEYLNSGEAWLLVGSGPSIEAGLPSWRELAEGAHRLALIEGQPRVASRIAEAIEASNLPLAFERAATDFGMGSLITALRSEFVNREPTGRLYQLLARWPIPVYMTTNFDDAIPRSLVAQGEAYQVLSNSADHMNLLLPDANGFVVKLHGDLTTETGLVLTSSQYHALAQASEWDYWRTRMTSIFQMNRVVVIGYSLSDPHVRAALEAAKAGATITREVCWLAPNVPTAEVREYLEKYKVRVVPYTSVNNDHRGLALLLEDISKFVPARASTRIRRDIEAVVNRASREDGAATAVFVFNRLNPRIDLRVLRVDVAVAAAEAGFSTLQGLGRFSLAEGLAALGWNTIGEDADFARRLRRRLIRSGLLVEDGAGLRANRLPNSVAHQRRAFERLRDRFRQSVVIRLRRDFPGLDEDQAQRVATDLDDSLAGFFKVGGLTLATLLFTPRTRATTVPTSIVAFITEAAARYDAQELRQAFWHASVASFVDAGDAERSYLGRLAQGFFAFHAVGVFGEVAAERLVSAKSTVWILDSNVQIPAIALGAPSNRTYRDSLLRMSREGVRLFTTARLFDETVEHLGFARELIRRYGPESPYVIQAATGQPPYRRQNEFLQGFIQWQAAGRPADWELYLFEAFGHRAPTDKDVRAALGALGVEVIELRDWPGFTDVDYGDVQAATDAIKELMREHRPIAETSDIAYEQWLEDKVPPESEACVIVKRERSGRYYMLGEPGAPSPAMFVSSTAVVNAIDAGPRVTLRPEAFLGFIGTLVPSDDRPSPDRAFEVVLWSMAEAGINPISEQTIEDVFGRVIDQATLKVNEQREALAADLPEKYGEDPEAVIRRLPPSRRLLAALQLSNELINVERSRAASAEAREADAKKRARAAETDLANLSRFKRRYNDRVAKISKRKRRRRNSN